MFSNSTKSPVSGSNLARMYWAEKGGQMLMTILSAKGSFILPGAQDKTLKSPFPLLSLSLSFLTHDPTSKS